MLKNDTQDILLSFLNSESTLTLGFLLFKKLKFQNNFPLE